VIIRKSIILLFCILIPSLLFNFSCRKEKESQEGDIEVVINENNPQNPSLSLRFEENLSITREGWLPVDIAVDDEENIYVFGAFEKSIYKFNSQGSEIFKKVFPKGTQGPGEFNFMDPYFSSDGRLYIFDKALRRITILNEKCEVQDIKKIEGARFLLQMDSIGNMFFWVGRYSPNSSKKILTKFSHSGKLLDEIFEYSTKRVTVDKEKNIMFFELYPRCGIYKLGHDDNVYYALSDKYEINVVSPKGKLIKKIVKKGQSRKVTNRDIEKLTPQTSRAARSKREYISPKHVPYIADLFILDNKYLLVITHESDYDEENVVGDLFDENDVFQTRVEVPKYSGWYRYSSFYGFKNNALYKKNHFYTIEVDESEENFYVKRYKMIWDDKQ
jgi:hypothetical protein